MKTWKHFTFAAFLVIFVILAFITCDTGNNGPETYTITFDSDGGTSITAQTVAENGRVTEPAAPTKENDIAGLYMGTPDDYTFAGWYNGDTKWDFNAPVTANISLKAKWVSPAPAVDISTSYGNNIFDKAFSYLNGNEGIYTLLLDEDVETMGGSHTSATTIANLTIIGIGGERTITPQGYESGGNTYYNSIFSLWGEGNILTIGKHITLKGANDETVIEKSPLVHIEDGAHFIMLPGSKITGHTSTGNSTNEGAINTGSWYGYPGYFTMEGGEISGNNTTYCIALWEGTFTMNGGTITKNSGDRAVHTSESNLIINGGIITENSFELDDLYIDARSHFSLSGNTTFNKIRLTSYFTDGLKPINITGPYSGTAASLDLIKGNGGTFEDGVVVMQAVEGYTITTADMNRFTLGNFMTSFNGVLDAETQPINDTHKLELDPVNNAVKLVAK